MAISSFSDFQAALNGLVAQTNPRARRNMAVRVLPSGAVEADTPEEMAAYQRAMSKTSKKSAFARPEQTSRRAAEPIVREYRPFTRELRDPQGELTYEQAKSIGFSIGGVDAYCPQLKGQAVLGGTHKFALSKMGLTKEKASRVIDEMQRAGVLYGKTKAQHEKARMILETVGQVSCPRPDVPMASNPRRRGW